MAEDFLGRWSQRKQAVRAGKVVVEPAAPAKLPSPPAVPESGEMRATAPEPSATPALTLADVQCLTTESDFAPFVARDVVPEVRNAAMKKLFSDPHFNVMDRLDIYIDDYSKPDPLPETMLRTMVSAKFLNLFEEETPQPQLRDDPHTPSIDSVAQSGQPSKPDMEPYTQNQPPAQSLEHDHPDLRLQPHHAAGCPEPGGGTQ